MNENIMPGFKKRECEKKSNAKRFETRTEKIMNAAAKLTSQQKMINTDQLNHDMENSHPSTSTSCNTDVDPGVNLLSTNPVMITEDTPVDIDLGFRDGVEEVSCSVLHLSDVNLLGNGRNLVVVSAEENVNLSGCHNLVIVPAEENVDLSKEHSHDMFNLKNVSTHFSETTDTFNLDVDIISNEIEVGNAYEDLDPDYIPSNEHESDYDYVPTEEKEQDGVIDNVKVTESEYSRNEADILPPKKKIKCDRALEKQKKDKGLEYLTRQGEIRPGRSFCFLENCCRKKCNLKIDKTKQEQIFNDFMGIGNQLTKDQILADNIVIKSKGTERKGRSITGQTKDSLVTINFTTPLLENNKVICKKMFQNIFGISRGKIDVIVHKKKASETGIIGGDGRGKHEPINKRTSEREAIIEHIESIPKYQSHYSRRHTRKMYFFCQMNIKKLHEMYVVERTEKKFEPLSYKTYAKIFNSLGYKFKSPSIDTCKTCDTFTNKLNCTKNEEERQKLESDKKIHLEKADLGYTCKAEDKKTSMLDEHSRMICFDLQQCLPTPCLNTNVVYYKRQLWTFNFTIRDCTTNSTHCYMWHEGISGRGSDEIASCLINYFSSIPSEVTNITAYSDSCPGQNKNINVCAAVSYFVSKSETISLIDHKFLEPGHTRLECDADHARIERAKKDTTIEIRVPQEWYQMVRTVRGKKPFHVKEMTQNDFYKYSSLVGKTLVKRVKNLDGDTFNWHNIRWIRYNKEFGIIEYKNSLNQGEEFKTFDLRSTKRGRPEKVQIPHIHFAPVSINPKKKKDLLSLLHLIDPLCHQFYQNLVTSSSAMLPGDWAESSDEENE